MKEKEEIGEEEERVVFDYVLMCNKICGQDILICN